jgi:hypothetical protein
MAPKDSDGSAQHMLGLIQAGGTSREHRREREALFILEEDL